MTGEEIKPPRSNKIWAIVTLVIILSLAGVGVFLWRNANPSTSPSSTISDPWEERIAAGLEDKECTEKPPTFPADHYQGPLVDAHFHPASIPDAAIGSSGDYQNEKLYTSLGINITMGDFVCMFKADGTTPRNILAFFPVYSNIKRQAVEVAKRTVEQYPGVFVPFINPPDEDISTVDAATLDELLKIYPGFFKGYGEIALYGKPDLPPDSPILQEIYDVLRKNDVKKVFFHLGEGQKDAFRRTLTANPDLTFIFHGDQLIDCEACDNTLKDIDEILSNHDNVYYGVDELWGDVFLLREDGSKEEVLNHFKDYEPLLKKDVALWKPFIEKHQDKVMWDSDRGTYLWTTDLEVGRALVKYVRRFIAELDPAVQEKYAYKNAERVLAGQ